MARSRRRQASKRGASVIFVVAALATVQFAIDVFVVNVVQILMAQRQLSGVCEAASLAGTAMLARIDVANDDVEHHKLSLAQKAACRCAENMVRHGHILGSNLIRAERQSESADLNSNIHSGDCRYVVRLTDPDDNFRQVEFGDARGRTISCSIAYGFKPLLLSFVGNACYTIVGNCIGGLPQIDSVLVFDLSCSMDDQTPVTFVRREWIHSQLGAGHYSLGTVDAERSKGCGIIQYVSLHCPQAVHTLSNYLGWNYEAGQSATINGSLVNVLPPQNLDKAANDANSAITHPMFFDAYLRSHYSHYDSKLRYKPWEGAGPPRFRALDYATPPGNCDLSLALGGNGDALTDMAGNPALPINAVPQLNAFSDTTWQNDGVSHFGYQPAAPGALLGMADNDPIPSPDQQTFTDLVVNICDPYLANNPGRNTGDFVGFIYRFPADDPDPLLRNQSFSFPNIAVVVEAARGNLEATPALPVAKTNAEMALIDRLVSVDGTIFDMRSVELKDGYQRAYERLAMLSTQPLAGILAAADESYLQKLHKLTDCRFGLVGFSSKGPLSGHSYSHLRTFGTADDQSTDHPQARSFYVFTSPYANSNFANATYDSGVPTMGGSNETEIENGNGRGFRVPRLPLDAVDEHFSECLSKNNMPGGRVNDHLNNGPGSDGIYNFRVQSTADLGEALESARSMFHSNTYDPRGAGRNRIPARKAIIVVTDGEPTNGVTGSEAQGMFRIAGRGDGGSSGATCESDGIAVFTISLNQLNGKAFYTLKQHQEMLFGDKPASAGQTGGIAWRAGHGGRYYPCQSSEDLKLAFSDISRRFSQSLR